MANPGNESDPELRHVIVDKNGNVEHVCGSSSCNYTARITSREITGGAGITQRKALSVAGHVLDALDPSRSDMQRFVSIQAASDLNGPYALSLACSLASGMVKTLAEMSTMPVEEILGQLARGLTDATSRQELPE